MIEKVSNLANFLDFFLHINKLSLTIKPASLLILYTKIPLVDPSLREPTLNFSIPVVV